MSGWVVQCCFITIVVVLLSLFKFLCSGYQQVIINSVNGDIHFLYIVLFGL